MKRSYAIAYVRDSLLVVLAAPILLLLSAATAIYVSIYIGSPIFFRQMRAGLNGGCFSLLKFRSMTNAVDDDGNLLPDNQRLGKAGKLIRRFRMDELPSFVHVLSGSISLVGPRPLPISTILAHPLGERRLKGKPGFTGLAQVSGNTLLSTDEKFAIDVYYLEQRTGFTDLTILAKTIATVLKGESRNETLIRLALARVNAPDVNGEL